MIEVEYRQAIDTHTISYAYLSHVKPMECQSNDP